MPRPMLRTPQNQTETNNVLSATCNNEENQSKRVEIKELIKTLKQVNPHVESNIFRSVENVNIDTVIAYKQNGVKHNFLDEYDNK